MIDTLSSSDARYNFSLFALPVFRNNNCDGLTNRLFGRVAKYPLGSLIPVCDNTIEILAYDRVVTGFDDGGLPAKTLFAFLKGS